MAMIASVYWWGLLTLYLFRDEFSRALPSLMVYSSSDLSTAVFSVSSSDGDERLIKFLILLFSIAWRLTNFSVCSEWKKSVSSITGFSCNLFKPGRPMAQLRNGRAQVYMNWRW